MCESQNVRIVPPFFFSLSFFSKERERKYKDGYTSGHEMIQRNMMCKWVEMKSWIDDLILFTTIHQIYSFSNSMISSTNQETEL